MRGIVTGIRAPEPDTFGPDGEPIRWAPMVLTVRVLIASGDEASKLYRQACAWSYPRDGASEPLHRPASVEIREATSPAALAAPECDACKSTLSVAWFPADEHWWCTACDVLAGTREQVLEEDPGIPLPCGACGESPEWTSHGWLCPTEGCKGAAVPDHVRGGDEWDGLWMVDSEKGDE